GTDAAAAAYRRTYEIAALSVDSRNRQFGDFAFELIVNEQLIAGDEQGTRETIKRTPTIRTAARCWLRISNLNLAQEDTKSASTALNAAFDLLNRDGFEPNLAEDMALVASNAARAGEKAIAQRLFKRALALSDADKPPKSKHPFIASFQA